MYWAGRPYLLESDSLYNGQAAHHLYAVCLSVCLSVYLPNLYYLVPFVSSYYFFIHSGASIL